MIDAKRCLSSLWRDGGLLEYVSLFDICILIIGSFDLHQCNKLRRHHYVSASLWDARGSSPMSLLITNICKMLGFNVFCNELEKVTRTRRLMIFLLAHKGFSSKMLGAAVAG
ncbi:unnamed protein product [Amoebophrya sp. A25]|nr:unnamed protein product [Amoebophrya sp. A25]|eukprot:GSA25T00013870001.1